MNNYIVTRALKKRTGEISHVVVRPGGGTETVRYSAIRAGLSWPTATMSAYSCIVGELRHSSNAPGHKGSLRLLSEYEYEGLSVESIFDKLTDDLSRMHCANVYTETIDKKFKDYVEAFQTYVFNKHITIGRLEQAPFADNFQLGILMINDWLHMGLFKLPEKSIVREQLKQISKFDLNEKPGKKFCAINGLRYAVAAFQKFRPVKIYKGRGRRRSAMAI